MLLSPTANKAEFATLLARIMVTRGGRFQVIDQDLTCREVVTQLACDGVWARKEVALAAQQAIWQVSGFMGMPFQNAAPLVDALVRDKLTDMIVPILDIDLIPFELLCILMDAGNEMEVGPLLFRMDSHRLNNAGWVSQVLAAAIVRKWQAPVLFIEAGQDVPLETVELDWRKMLYFNTYDLPTEALAQIVGESAKRPFEKLGPDEWTQICRRDELAWEAIQDELFGIYCDLFEEFDINETFPLLKRYIIPSWNPREMTDVLSLQEIG